MIRPNGSFVAIFQKLSSQSYLFGSNASLLVLPLINTASISMDSVGTSRKDHCWSIPYCGHNDVLCQNIIFGDDGSQPSAHLIDFDYAHLDEYPQFWNTRFLERHPQSREGEATCAIHDVYAAIAILCNFFTLDGQPLHDTFANGPFTKDEHPKLKSDWEKASAEKVGSWIRKNAKSLGRKSQ